MQKAIKAALCAGATLALTWAATTNAISNVFAKKNPPLAMMFGWADGPTLAENANLRMKLSALNKSADKQVPELAKMALAKEAINPQALSILALDQAVQGNDARAYWLMRLSDRQSRRILAGQVWLAEYLLKADKIDEALDKFDTAMRVSVEGQKMLLPVLATALSDERVFTHAIPILKRKPSWLPSLVEASVALPEAQPHVARAIAAIGGLPGADSSCVSCQSLFSGLIAGKHYNQAKSLYLVQNKGKAASLSSLAFDAEAGSGGYFPIAWELVQSDKSTPVWELGPKGQTRLTASSTIGANGTIARKLLFLKPGKYQIKIAASSDGQASSIPLKMSMACASSNAPLAAASIRQTGTTVADVNISANCAEQFLNLTIDGIVEGSSARSYIDSISLVKM